MWTRLTRPTISFWLSLTLAFIAAASPIVPGRHIVYQDGQYVSISDVELKQTEQTARFGGHMPWRQDPLLTASVLAADLSPQAKRLVNKWREGEVRGHRALLADHLCWGLLGEHDGKALVQLKLQGRTTAEIRLVRPFTSWWYVSSARLAIVKRSKLVAIHPDGTREYLPGPLIFKRGHAYLPACDVRRCGLEADWDAKRRAVAIYARNTDFVVWYRPGSRITYAWTPHPSQGRIPYRPLLRKGRVYLRTEEFPQLTPTWNADCRELELHIRPGWR